MRIRLQTIRTHMGDINSLAMTFTALVSGADDHQLHVHDFRPSVFSTTQRFIIVRKVKVEDERMSWMDASLSVLNEDDG